MTIGRASPLGSDPPAPAGIDRGGPPTVRAADAAPERLALRRQLGNALRDRLPPTLRAARWAIDGRSFLVLGVLCVVAVGAVAALFGGEPRTEAVTRPTFTTASAPPTALDDEPSAHEVTVDATVVVHVAGLVARPGVYELPAGSRVIDAVEAAGGAIAGTDLSQLNLARLVVDGEQVAVGVPPAPGGAGAPAGPLGTEEVAPIDLNVATEADLDSLPGVGPVLAARIVAWRQENGRFSSVDELLEVSGIGEATLGDIAPLVRV